MHQLKHREKKLVTSKDVAKRLKSQDTSSIRAFLSRNHILRFEIFVTVAPIIIVAIVIRVLLENFANFKGVIPSSVVTPFAGTCMFLIAVCIGGVLEDFKEAERLPAVISSNLECISENIEFARVAMLRRKHRAHHAHGEAPHAKEKGGHGGHELLTPDCSLFSSLQGDLLSVSVCILEYLGQLRSFPELLTLCTTTSVHISESMESSGFDHLPKEVGDSFAELRDAITRVDVIKHTNFIPSGYALLTCLVHFTCALLTISSFEVPLEVGGGGGGGRRLANDGGGTSSLVELNLSTYFPLFIYVFLFQYTLLLIDALEDPFNYSIAQLLPSLETSSDGSLAMFTTGGAEADVYPLFDIIARLLARSHILDKNKTSFRGLGEDFNSIKKTVEMMSLTGDRNQTPSMLLDAVDTAMASQSAEAAEFHEQRLAFRHLLDDSLHTALFVESKDLGRTSLSRRSADKHDKESLYVPINRE